MGKKSKDAIKEEIKLEMTPMIDVTFLLLVFFLCTIRFKTLEGKLSAYLPRDGTGGSPAEQPEPIDLRLSVTAPGTKVHPPGHPSAGLPWDPAAGSRFAFAPGTREVAWSVGPHRYPTLDALESRLRALAGETPQRRLEIDARPGTVYAEVVAVLDRAVAAGLRDIAFVGARGERLPARAATGASGAFSGASSGKLGGRAERLR